jgi:hypothetical protein
LVVALARAVAIPETVELAKTFVPKSTRILWSASGHVLLAEVVSRKYPDSVGSIRIFDSSGAQVLAINPHKDLGAVRFATYSAGIDPQTGTVILGGAGQPASGEPHGSVLFYNAQGVLLKEVRTGHRLPLAAAIDPSGNVWVFLPNPPSMDETRTGDYKLLECYTSGGVLLRQALWRSQLPAEVDLGGEGPELGGRFFFGASRDGMYMFVPQTHQLFETDFDGNLKTNLSIFKPEMTSGRTEGSLEMDYKMLDGLAFTRSGDVLGSYAAHFVQGGQERFAFGLFRLNRQLGRWDLLGEISEQPVPGTFLGVTRDDKLVYLVHDEEKDSWKLQFVSR